MKIFPIIFLAFAVVGCQELPLILSGAEAIAEDVAKIEIEKMSQAKPMPLAPVAVPIKNP